MDKKEPKFVVGEIVQVVSRRSPHLNIDRTMIVRVAFYRGNWVYITEHIDGLLSGAGRQIAWVESVLRKLPPKHEAGSWDALADIWIPERDKVTA